MPGNERIKRKRIKDKSMDAIHDLVLAEMAGVMPDKKDVKNGYGLCDLYYRHSLGIENVIKDSSVQYSKNILNQYMFESYSILIPEKDTPVSENIILSIMKKSSNEEKMKKFIEKDTKLKTGKKERLKELRNMKNEKLLNDFWQDILDKPESE
ncbi:MAG TPA: hypothetical protein VMX17_06115 [Candidatus Glassbacteria bacterium]|nr:hypothetical protein [Candidatus Glassbacteria bacterium]